MSALAEELTGVDLDRGIGIFSRRSQAQGASEWTRDDARRPALHRLYRTTASEHWVLDPAGHPVHGHALDHRTPMTVWGAGWLPSLLCASRLQVMSRPPLIVFV